jgi:outer membrane protein OmpA-like peptidoglycan-associated protein
MKQRIKVFACFSLFFLFTGCCASSMVVLIPDEEGHVGQVAVTTEAGQQILSEANHAVDVMDKSAPPGSVTRLSSEKIRSIFSEALDARPVPPARYVLYFLSGSNELTEESRVMLPEIFKTIQSRQSNDIVISGHTDTVGDKNNNYKLGEERAYTTYQILVENGANPAIITVTSHGEGNPLIKTADEVAEPRNRRVEVTIR